MLGAQALRTKHRVVAKEKKRKERAALNAGQQSAAVRRHASLTSSANCEIGGGTVMPAATQRRSFIATGKGGSQSKSNSLYRHKSVPTSEFDDIRVAKMTASLIDSTISGDEKLGGAEFPLVSKNMSNSMVESSSQIVGSKSDKIVDDQHEKISHDPPCENINQSPPFENKLEKKKSQSEKEVTEGEKGNDKESPMNKVRSPFRKALIKFTSTSSSPRISAQTSRKVKLLERSQTLSMPSPPDFTPIKQDNISAEISFDHNNEQKTSSGASGSGDEVPLSDKTVKQSFTERAGQSFNNVSSKAAKKISSALPRLKRSASCQEPQN